MTYPYSFRAMEAHVRTLVGRHALANFHWAGAGNAPNGMRDVLFAYYPNREIEQLITQAGRGSLNARRQLVACELSVYCHVRYEAALAAKGDQAIGREADIGRAGLYEQLGNMVTDHLGMPTTNLFDIGAQGNVLKMDKWATHMNDAWILGGMHRGANFRLVSRRIAENLWNAGGGYLIVTAREMLGLNAFGYQMQQIGPQQVFVQQTRASRFENLVSYDDMIRRAGRIDDAMMLGVNVGAQAQRKRNVMADIRQNVPRVN